MSGPVRWLGRLSLRAQVLLVVIGALALAQAIALWLFADERDLAVRAALVAEAFSRIANVVALLERTPPEVAPALLQAASSPLVAFTLDPAPVVDHADHAPGRLAGRLRELLGPGRPLRIDLHELRGPMPPMPGMPGAMMGPLAATEGQPPMPMPPGALRQMPMMAGDMTLLGVELQASVGMSGGRWLNVTTRFHRPPMQWAWRDVATFAITAAVLLVATWWVLGRIVRPLARLSQATDRLGRGDWVPDLPDSGPAELARLTTAFNRMQDRLRRFVDERSRLLAALGHDLRSPLTALRVRAEMVDDDETRAALIASIDEMQEMTEATLTFARGTATAEEVAEIDLHDFLEALVRDYRQTGRDVTLARPPAGLQLRGRPVALRRALRNLIDNALRYGRRARLQVEVAADEIRIHIDDDGPGLSPENLSRVFEPFLRLEESRSRETGGVGLGLAIARSILRAHGGEVTLSNRSGGGLRATASLPRETGAGRPDDQAAPDMRTPHRHRTAGK